MQRSLRLGILIVLVTVIGVGCNLHEERGPDVVPTKHVLPTAVSINTAVPPTPGDDSWKNIQSSGKIIVGTTADYLPFAYYDPNFKLNGFDIALMHEIGGKLNVEVVLKDMAFEGLPNALESGQVNAAIGAISITEEREKQVDFSSVYLVSADAVVAAVNANFSTRSIDDLIPYRIGVEKGSVYEKSVYDNLVINTKVPADHLHVYTSLNQAIKDLQDGQIDLIMLDLLPAQQAEKSGLVKIVGQELNRQQYGIAVKAGSERLQNA